MKLYKHLSLVSLSVLAYAMPAQAQNTPAAPNSPTAAPATTPGSDVSSNDNDIVVTARRREERLQDVPLTVSAVRADTLSKDQIRNFQDVATLVPGLTLTPSADGISPSATLRGVNYNVAASGSNGTVDFYLNDAPIAAGLLFQSMFDVGQIEVLHGPQGTLRGLSSPSGSITVTTARPDLYKIGGYMDGTVANAGTQNVNGAVNLPIIEGKLAVRVAGVYSNDQSNRVHSVNDPNFTPYNHTYGERVTVRFDPIDSIDIEGSYQHLIVQQSNFDQVESAGLATGTAISDTLITAKDRESIESTPRRVHEGYDIFRLQAEWKFAGQKLQYIGGWSKSTIISKYAGDTGGYFIDLGVKYPGNANASYITSPNIYNYGQNTDSQNRIFSHELRLSSDDRVLGIFDYVVGGLVNRSVAPTSLVTQTPQFLVTTPPFQSYYGIKLATNSLVATTLENSVYGNLTAHIDDKTELSGGLRHIIFHNYSSLDFLDPGGVAKFNATIYSASIKHRFNENILAYANTGSSWRIGAGTTGIILEGSGQYGTVTDPALAALYGYTPETSKSYEVGFKTDWFDKKLLVNLAYYHQNFHNYIYASPGNIYGNYNSATAPATPVYMTRYSVGPLTSGVPVTINGLEGEIGYRFSRQFNIDVVLSYTKSKISNGLVPCNYYDANGNPIAPVLPKQINFCTANYTAGLSAPFSATVQSEYSHRVGPVNGFVRGLMSFYGNSQNDPTNPYDNVKAYAIVNAYLGVRDPNGVWEVSAYIKNLFNTERVLSRGVAVNAVPYALVTATGGSAGSGSINSNYRAITMTAPQEFGLNLHVAFGGH